jgi:IS5 family transposase
MFGEEGVEKLLSATIQAGLSCGAIKQKSFDNVIVDTTVQEKAIAYPTDAKLYHKMRIRLVSIAKKYEIALRQSYERVGKKAFVNCNRHFHSKRNNQAEQELRHLKTMLTRVRNDMVRKIRNNDNLKSEFQEILDLADRLLVQKRDDKKKLYSIHAPEVECISKGKVRKQYEFGNKVSITTTSKEGFVIGALGLHGNPYDGHTLAMSVRQCERLISRKLKNIWVDLGFRGHDYIGSATVNLCGFGVELPGNLSRSQRRLYKRRASIEPIIGHMKNDGRLGRNYLLGVEGDKMNVILCACGQNLRLLANWFREFFGLLINLVRILVKTASFWLKSRRVLPVLAMAQ